MGIEDIVSKYDLYNMIVKDPCIGRIVKNPEFELPCENIDEIYIKIKKFQRGLNQEEMDKVMPYLESVEKGYVSKDFSAFENGVKDLMWNLYLL